MYDLKNENCLIRFDETEESKFSNLLEKLEQDVVRTIDLGDVEVISDSELGETCKTGLFLRVEGRETYPITEGALFSVKRRADNSAGILSKLSSIDAAKMLNISWPYRKGKEAILFTRGNNLLGLHSSRYVVIPQKAIIQKLRGYLGMDFDSYKFIEATYTHQFTIVTYEIESKEIKEYYKKALEDAKLYSLASDLRFFIRLITGDSAESAIGIHPMISFGRGLIPFTLPIKIEHKDNVGIEDVSSSFKALYSGMEKELDHYKDMLNIELNYPSYVIYKAAKKYRLPMRLIKPLASRFNREALGETMTVHDLYLEAAGFMEDPRFEKKSMKEQFEERDALSRLLRVSEAEWRKMDTPTGKTFIDD